MIVMNIFVENSSGIEIINASVRNFYIFFFFKWVFTMWNLSIGKSLIVFDFAFIFLHKIIAYYSSNNFYFHI